MPINSSGTATFSSAVMVGIRWKDWNTMPTRPRRKRASASSPIRVMSVPAIATRPAVGFSSPAATISSDDLPEPDAPVSATLSPAATASDTPDRISTGPARLLRVRRMS